jgi:hypothetical protein
MASCLLSLEGLAPTLDVSFDTSVLHGLSCPLVRTQVQHGLAAAGGSASLSYRPPGPSFLRSDHVPPSFLLSNAVSAPLANALSILRVTLSPPALQVWRRLWPAIEQLCLSAILPCAFLGNTVSFRCSLAWVACGVLRYSVQ